MVDLTVITALRRFLPAFLRQHRRLPPQVWRAIRSITGCRTPAMGGQRFVCRDCEEVAFAYHSCNHRACPQCGKTDTAAWVERELNKRVNAPYFMVTFTLPAELRGLFFGPLAKEAYDLFFKASSGALAEKLAMDRQLRARQSGFTAVLHTWNQRLLFHPHIHYIVPGAGIDPEGNVVTVKKPDFLVYLPLLRKAFRAHFHQALKELKWEADPTVWNKDWGVQIQPFGNGANAIKYLGNYVCRTAIADSRIIAIDEQRVTFRWKDRNNGGHQKTETLSGLKFVERYLRHVLPKGMRAIRYYGFCHPAAKKNRERIAFHLGKTLFIGPSDFSSVSIPLLPFPNSKDVDNKASKGGPSCPCCQQPMVPLETFTGVPHSHARPPPDPETHPYMVYLKTKCLAQIL